MTRPSNYNRNRIPARRHRVGAGSVIGALITILLVLAFYGMILLGIIAGVVVLCRAAW